MLAELFSWWLSQMRSMLPGHAAGVARRPDAIIIAVDNLPNHEAEIGETSGTIIIRRNGHEKAVQALELSRRQQHVFNTKLAIGIRLPADAMLQRDVALPIAAERDITTVVGFEMDRLTPFSADEIFWGISGLTRDQARERLHLRISIVLQSRVQALLDALARIKVVPSFIESAGEQIELAAGKGSPGKRTQMVLSMLCAGLAIACLVTPFVRQQIALDNTARTIATLAPAEREAFRLRQRLATAASGRTAIAKEQRSSDVLLVLATLTRALPDGTWLGDLALKKGILSIDGHSTNAARLISLLSATSHFRNPTFTAPVTRSVDGRVDLFSLRTSVAG